MDLHVWTDIPDAYHAISKRLCFRGLSRSHVQQLLEDSSSSLFHGLFPSENGTDVNIDMAA